MKKIIFAIVLLSGIALHSQSAGFGIKGGLNYGEIGDAEFSTEFATETFSKENKTGYHAGIFYKIELAGLFLQPEIMYTKLNTAYSGESTVFQTDGDLDFELSKIDAPILLGLDLIGPINIKAGPSFQYILDSGFDGDNTNFEDPEKSITVGYQLGVGISLKQLGFDVRYEGGFTDNTIVSENSVENAGFTVDTRPSQWILSLSYSFGDN